MTTILFRASACFLLLAVLFMLGGATGASVVHDLQHAAHHTAASHSKGICAWMCATGGIAQQAWPSLAYTWHEAELIASFPDHQPALHIPISLTPRAPPV